MKTPTNPSNFLNHKHFSNLASDRVSLSNYSQSTSVVMILVVVVVLPHLTYEFTLPTEPGWEIRQETPLVLRTSL